MPAILGAFMHEQHRGGGSAALFVTCMVDFFRPAIGFAAARLLERAGFGVEVPIQSCCGQPAYNSGDDESARAVARRFIASFEGKEHIVTPSGSCAAMVRRHLVDLFDGEPEMQARAARVAERTSELTEFLSAKAGKGIIEARREAVAIYHHSCSGLRELAIRDQPRALLAQVDGLVVGDYDGAETCCGFGGTFCVKYSDISLKICGERCDEIERSGAELLLGGDLSCLLNLGGMLARRGSPVEVRHMAEILAGRCDEPAIGRPPDEGA